MKTNQEGKPEDTEMTSLSQAEGPATTSHSLNPYHHFDKQRASRGDASKNLNHLFEVA